MKKLSTKDGRPLHLRPVAADEDKLMLAATFVPQPAEAPDA